MAADVTATQTRSSSTGRFLKKASSMLRFAIGLDLGRITAYRHLPKYLADRRKFKQAGGHIARHFPILSEFAEQAGTASGHYFHQDLLVASFIHKANPNRHIDIGSRIDGFVAHVASFREIEVMDVRELKPTAHENIKFIQANLMIDDASFHEIADSISCLHAIEHFGLGRYGDPVDPNGYLKGFANIAKMPKVGGTLYISFPIGTATSVYFNAHRVFNPHDILTWPGHENLKLVRFDYVDDSGMLHKDFSLMGSIPNLNYGCGIYTFLRLD
jgi:hypothetical protein